MTTSDTAYKSAILHLGFRPFFLGAGTSAVLLILAWMLIYQFGWSTDLNNIPATYWHAHEMVYGYAMAIVAGFMLTATKNWTGLQTLNGYKLLALFLLWAISRFLPFAGTVVPVAAMAVTDLLFAVILLLHIALLIVKTGQRRQYVFLLLLLLLLAGNTAFYTGLLRHDPLLMRTGIYTGFYLILSMVIIMGGRVIPFFIERGVGYPVTLNTRKWLEWSSILLFMVYWLLQVFTSYQTLCQVMAGVLFVLHAWRLQGWHTPGLWRKPLLWVLYLAYAMLVAGFLLHALTGILRLSPYLSLHAFGYGGVGVVTLGMMCRVAWGHTGREIAAPPRSLPLMFIALICGAVVRSLLPAVFPGDYALWIGLSQLLWIVAFATFLYVFTRVLVLPRVDGKYG